MNSVPDEFRCPIGMDIMKDPVLCEDGNTYERDNIIRWLDTSPVSPMTRQPMNKANIRPNYALKSLIQNWNKPPPMFTSPPPPSAPPGGVTTKVKAPKPSAPPSYHPGVKTDYVVVIPPQLPVTTPIRPQRPADSLAVAGDVRMQQRRKLRNMCGLLGLLFILIAVISSIRNNM